MTRASDPDFACRLELPGWRLVFADLTLGDAFDAAVLDARLAAAETALRRRSAGGDATADPVLAALRELFKAAGTSPSRYRPSSEALVRRVLKGDPLPRIQPLVDLNNLVSIDTLCPACVMRPDTVHPPLLLRRGAAGETVTGFKGELDLDGKPVLADREGPFGTPITDDHRVVLHAEHREALLVVYEPRAATVGSATYLAGLAGSIPGLTVGPVRVFE
ncbi:MAG TPA: phenylalanine--tRNA ligase beta subunit-related protein [Acidobacteriota bacterium]|nr:phenylalanine--tRNA ligase beta subunit-related protein [Acidobacteriota bacterium]